MEGSTLLKAIEYAKIEAVRLLGKKQEQKGEYDEIIYCSSVF